MRDIEGPAGTDLLATCRELGVAVTVNSVHNKNSKSKRYRPKILIALSLWDEAYSHPLLSMAKL